MSQTSTVAADAAFGALLRHWRAARRVSQLELSLETDVSQRHLSFLESGRSHPSRAMVVHLSEALDIPLRERNTLLQAAGFAPVYRERGLSEAAMAPVRDALERMLDHHDPYPAVVFDRDYDLMMENRAFVAMTRLFGDRDAMWAACCPDRRPNLLRLTFHPRGARPYIRNFAEVAPAMLQRVYHEALASNSEPVLAFISELRADPDVPARWNDDALLSAPSPVLPLVLGNGDLTISLFSVISTFGTPYDVTTDEIRVETFFPGDAGTESFLRNLAGPQTA